MDCRIPSFPIDITTVGGMDILPIIAETRQQEIARLYTELLEEKIDYSHITVVKIIRIVSQHNLMNGYPDILKCNYLSEVLYTTFRTLRKFKTSTEMKKTQLVKYTRSDTDTLIRKMIIDEEAPEKALRTIHLIKEKSAPKCCIL